MTWAPATGQQLWRLNSLGLLPVALRRGGRQVDHATARELLTEWHELAGACPRICEWPMSCIADGCFLREQANGREPRPDPYEGMHANIAESYRRWRKVVL